MMFASLPPCVLGTIDVCNIPRKLWRPPKCIHKSDDFHPVSWNIRRISGLPKGPQISPSKKILGLGGGFKYFLFSPLPGEMIQFD